MIHRRLGARFAMAGLLLLAGAALTGPAYSDEDSDERDARHAGRDRDSDDFQIRTLSNRADLISGGDALVEVRVPKSVAPQQVTLSLNGRNVTSAFRADSTGRVLRGVLTGLVQGRNK